MYEVTGYAGKDVEDPHCEKMTECLLVRCTLGTYEGPMCPKCLVRAVRIRSVGPKKPQPLPNGEPVTQP